MFFFHISLKLQTFTFLLKTHIRIAYIRFFFKFVKMKIFSSFQSLTQDRSFLDIALSLFWGSWYNPECTVAQPSALHAVGPYLSSSDVLCVNIYNTSSASFFQPKNFKIINKDLLKITVDILNFFCRQNLFQSHSKRHFIF